MLVHLLLNSCCSYKTKVYKCSPVPFGGPGPSYLKIVCPSSIFDPGILTTTQ